MGRLPGTFRPARWAYGVGLRGSVVEGRAVLLHSRSAHGREGRRGCVVEWSSRSRKRMGKALAAEGWDPGKVRLFVTLTFAEDGKVDGRHELALLRFRLRRRFGGAHALWWREFQERGVVHYHLLLEVAPRDAVVLRGPRVGGVRRAYGTAGWLSKAWAGCGGGFVRIDLWRGSVGALHRYAMKEVFGAGKAYQHDLPVGAEDGLGRWWGVWGSTTVWRWLLLSRRDYCELRRRCRRYGLRLGAFTSERVGSWWAMAPPDLVRGLGVG